MVTIGPTGEVWALGTVEPNSEELEPKGFNGSDCGGGRASSDFHMTSGSEDITRDS